MVASLETEARRLIEDVWADDPILAHALADVIGALLAELHHLAGDEWPTDASATKERTAA